MKTIVKNIVRGIALVALLWILISLMISQVKAQGPVLNRAEVMSDRFMDYGPVGVDGSVILTGLQLEQIGNSLLLAFDMEVNGRAMNNRQSWRIVPEITVPETGQFMEFPTLLITGRQKERHFKRKERFSNRWLMENYPDYKATIPKGTDTVITYRVAMPYEGWMEGAHLSIRQYLTSPKEKRQLFCWDAFAAVNHQEREPYTVEPLVNYIVPEKEVKHRSAGFSSLVDFPVNVSRIIPDYRGNRNELSMIDQQVGIITDNPHIVIQAIYMEGYASPDGSKAVNERLATQRVESLKKYFVDTYGISAGIISTGIVTEDWDGLRTIVDGWNNAAARARVLQVIDTADDPDTKEKRLRVLPEWVRLVNEVFPLLRRTEYRIDFMVRDFSMEQARSLISTHPELFSHYELYMLAMSYEADPDQRLEILETILRYFPEDDIALNNYAAALIDAGEIHSARRYLDRISDKSLAANNIGIIYLIDEQYDKAKRCFENSGREESIHNLQQLQLKIEEENRIPTRRSPIQR